LAAVNILEEICDCISFDYWQQCLLSLHHVSGTKWPFVCWCATYMCLSEELPYIQVPLHTVVKLSPVAYGCIAEFISLHIPAVDTYRPKPAVWVTLISNIHRVKKKGIYFILEHNFTTTGLIFLQFSVTITE